MLKNIPICPISHQHVDERVARLNGFTSLIFIVAGWYFRVLWLFLVIDFFFRSFKIKFSPIARFNKILTYFLKLEPIPIDAGPKKFAAKVGLVMAILLNIFSFFEINMALYIVSGFFILATSLESFFNYCLGCKMYAVFVELGVIKIDDQDIIKKQN